MTHEIESHVEDHKECCVTVHVSLCYTPIITLDGSTTHIIYNPTGALSGIVVQ